jgi:hypothetical protein
LLRSSGAEHFPKVHSFEALSRLTKLEDLLLTTLPSWYNTHQVVDTLRPLASLKKLRKLNFGGVLASDEDLSLLGTLRNLNNLFVSNIYPQEQLAKLAGRLPKVRRQWFLRPFVKFSAAQCKKCGSTKVMLSGSDIRPRVICPICQEKQFKACVTRFEEIANGARGRHSL